VKKGGGAGEWSVGAKLLQEKRNQAIGNYGEKLLEIKSWRGEWEKTRGSGGGGLAGCFWDLMGAKVETAQKRGVFARKTRAVQPPFSQGQDRGSLQMLSRGKDGDPYRRKLFWGVVFRKRESRGGVVGRRSPRTAFTNKLVKKSWYMVGQSTTGGPTNEKRWGARGGVFLIQCREEKGSHRPALEKQRGKASFGGCGEEKTNRQGEVLVIKKHAP